jgi:hypothetical protein
MSFFLIWEEQVGMDIIEYWLNVWQGSCQAMGSWWNSRCGTKERKTARQISARWRCFGLLEVFGEVG